MACRRGSAHGGVIVTGAGGGIGSAVALRFAQQGYGVVVNDPGVSVTGQDPSPGPAERVADSIRAAGGRAVSHHGSVADFDVAAQLVELAVSEYGRLDALVTCHGILRERMVFNMTEDDWDSVVKVHLKGTFSCFRFAAARMRQQRSGAMVALTSAAGLEGSPAQCNYAAAKAGVVGLALSTALAMGQYGVNVNCIVPSAATRMTGRLTERTAATRPASERQGPELIAELAVALADERCQHITGQLFTAAGRRLAWWQPPVEATSLELPMGPLSGDKVREAVCGRLGPQPLRRFAALGLPAPGTAPACGSPSPASPL